MAGMYPNNKEITSFGKTVRFPGVNAQGKFTNGDFSNPDEPPSFLDADTINLIIDNLNSLIAHLGSSANNTSQEQLSALFTSAAVANKAIKRDSFGRAKVAPPVESDDIARKEEVDAVSSALSSHSNRNDNPHKVTKAQIGLGNVDNTADINKTVKSAASCSGNSATAGKWQSARNINGLSVQGDADRTNYAVCSTSAATQAKTCTCAGFVLTTGAEITVKFTSTNTQNNPTLNVNSTGAKPIYYRGSSIVAGKLAANHTYTFRYNGAQYELVGDLDTVYNPVTAAMNGLMLSTDKTRLDENYIVAKNFGTSSGYIKYSNGLIIQWGISSGNETNGGVSRYGNNPSVVLPVSYTSKSSYAISCGFSGGGTVNWDEIRISNKMANSFVLSFNVHSYIAIGY